MKHRLLSALAVSGALIASALVLPWTKADQPAAAQAATEAVPTAQVAEAVVRKLAPSVRFTFHLLD